MNENTEQAKENNPEMEVYGNPDLWVLICKAEVNGKWMKSTKAMDTGGGVVLLVTTLIDGKNPAEALTFLPGHRIVYKGNKDKDGSTSTCPIIVHGDGIRISNNVDGAD